MQSDGRASSSLPGASRELMFWCSNEEKSLNAVFSIFCLCQTVGFGMFLHCGSDYEGLGPQRKEAQLCCFPCAFTAPAGTVKSLSLAIFLTGQFGEVY